MSTRILLTIGTDFHPFTRAIDWLDAWLVKHPEYADETVVQHGQSRPSAFARNEQYIAFNDLTRLIAEASVVITHGGPASIFEARAAGHLPICLPRDPALGEHVDGHQQRFTEFLARDNVIALCRTADEFEATLDDFLAHPEHGTVERDEHRVTEAVLNLDQIMAEFADRKRRGKRG